MAEVVRYVKNKGGEWTAEMKEDTLLRYMEKMAESGLIDLKISDDKVSFTPKMPPEKAKTQEKQMPLPNNNHEK